MTETKTVYGLAKELSQALVHDKRNDGSEFVKLADGSPEWMTDVVRAIHGDKLPGDTTYRFIERCADAIADADDSVDLQDVIAEMEPDVYTGKLTAWLAARVDHVYYMTQALEDFGGDVKDGFALLATAQKCQIEEIGFALVSELEKLAE